MIMENKALVILPAEIEQLAQGVSVEKRNEVQAVLNHVFNGVSKMREQLDLVVVSDENDKTSMGIANKIRLGVRQVRLDAEKEFDLKRSEVQQAMLSFKTEDQLWLKAKQTMQILTKEIEENAKWKEATKERIEAERKELKVQERIIKISKFNPEISRSEFENMSDSMFDLFFAGIEKQYNDKIEAEKQAELIRLEKERIQRLHEERKDAILTFWKYVAPEHRYDNLGELTDEEWDNLGKTLDDRKKAEDAENERIRLENERLQKETERKEAELKAEREKADEEKKKAEQRIRTGNARKDILFEIGVNLDFQSCADMPEDAWKEFFELKNKEYQAEQNRMALEKMKAERDAKKERERQAEELRVQKEKQAEAERQLQVQKEAEERRIQRERQRLIDEESEKAKAAKSPDKEKLTKWIESLNIATPELADLSAVVIATEISDKFEAFKNWANKQIEKL